MVKTMNLRNMTSIYLTYQNKILLLYRQGSRVVNNLWIGSAGGHFEEAELNNPKACVLRELQEELSISKDMLCDLQLRYITIRRANGEIRQNYYFFAELKDALPIKFGSNEGILKWFLLEELPELEMPFSAKYMLMHYLSTGMYDDKIYVGAADGKKVFFTELPDF